MKRSRFTEEQIIDILLEKGAGATVADRCRKQERRERLLKIAAGSTLEIKPGQQILDRLHFAQVGRQDRRREADLLRTIAKISHTGHRHRTDPDLGLGK